jgi:hypothetical protein
MDRPRAGVMPISHDGHAGSDFPFSRAAREDGGMLVPAPTAPPADPQVMRTADLTLRGWSAMLRARVVWPGRACPAVAPPLLLCFPDAGDRSGGLARALCAGAGMVVLEVVLPTEPREPSPAAFHDAVAALEWAADHGDELDADPTRLVVAGERAGGAVAGAMALHARDNWWPAVERQLLVHPRLDAWHASVPYLSSLESAPVGGVAPAVVIAGDDAADGGHRYAARLRRAGVAVDVLPDGPARASALARAACGA